jgi:hypothetical protein
MKLSPLTLGLLLVCTGCEVQRTLTVQTDPPGALVFLNDQEIGRGPVTRNFKWYGTYDVEVRAEGYESLRSQAKVWAPWWQWPPIDLVAVFIPGLTDHHEVSFTLHHANPAYVEPQAIIRRGERLEAQLESSDNPTTKPTTKPVKKKKAED